MIYTKEQSKSGFKFYNDNSSHSVMNELVETEMEAVKP